VITRPVDTGSVYRGYFFRSDHVSPIEAPEKFFFGGGNVPVEVKPLLYLLSEINQTENMERACNRPSST